MLQLPANLLAGNVEEFLAAVHAKRGEPLRVPAKFDLGGGLGGAVHSVQSIAQWARLAGDHREVVLPREFETHDSTRSRVASSLPGMAALYFAAALKAGKTDLGRYDALKSMSERVAAMQNEDFRNTLRGVGVGLVCFTGAQAEFLRSFYGLPERGAVRPHSDFEVLLPRLLGVLGGGIVEKLNDGQRSILAALVYQLFLNTDEHALSDAGGRAYRLGMRGLAVRQTTLEDVTATVEYADGDSALQAYLTKNLLSQTRQNKDAGSNSALKVVELSVFDTGPGMGLRWMSRSGASSYGDFSEAQEFDAIQQCFERHATTKAMSHSGLGLTMAMMAMKRLGAFMTLRTGRLSLYQDFSVGKAEAFTPKRRFGANRELAEIAGTAFTIWFKAS